MFMRKITMSTVVLFIVITFWLTGCDRIANQPTQTPYIPPTLAASQTPRLPPLPTAPVASPTQACTNHLRFIEDMSIPDGTVVEPESRLDKRWLVENSGTCNWDQHYQLRLSSGPEMGSPPIQALYPARSGTQLVIRIVYTAPQEPGIYRSAWQAYTPDDQPFGDPIFIEIVVQ